MCIRDRLAAIVFVIVAANTGLVYVLIENTKESRVINCDTSSDGASCLSDKIVRTATAEVFIGTVFALPSAPIEQLAYLNDVNMVIDMTNDPNVGRPVEATFKVTGAYKKSETQVILTTPNDYTIWLDATAKTGTITMGGSSFPVLESLPTGRRLVDLTDDGGDVNYDGVLETMTAKEAVTAQAKRRKLETSDGSALITAGSFRTAPFRFGTRRERRLGYAFGGMGTTGSFIMMSTHF
eukprot:43812-Prymnesium_polylepis.1